MSWLIHSMGRKFRLITQQQVPVVVASAGIYRRSPKKSLHCRIACGNQHSVSGFPLIWFIMIGLALLSVGNQKAVAAAGALDAGFDVYLAGGYVTATAIQPDGKILLGGTFATVNGQPRRGLVRSNADGTLEDTATFNIGTGADCIVFCIVVQPDGKIVIGGRFGKVNGANAPWYCSS